MEEGSIQDKIKVEGMINIKFNIIITQNSIIMCMSVEVLSIMWKTRSIMLK